MRNEPCRGHGGRVDSAPVRHLNHLKNLRKHLRHTECPRHVGGRKLGVYQVQRQRDRLVRVQLHAHALAHQVQGTVAVGHLVRVQQVHLGCERVIHAQPVTGAYDRVVQVVCERDNERV